MSSSTTVFNLIESADALRHITGADDATKRSRYAFKPKAKLLLAKRLRTVTTMLDDIEAHRKELLAEHKITGGRDAEGKPKDKQEDIDAFNNAWQEYGRGDVDVECASLDPELFDLDRNDIPVSFLTVLDWLIDLDALDKAPLKLKAAAAAAAE